MIKLEGHASAELGQGRVQDGGEGLTEKTLKIDECGDHHGGVLRSDANARFSPFLPVLQVPPGCLSGAVCPIVKIESE
jgi:hypothetical protein